MSYLRDCAIAIIAAEVASDERTIVIFKRQLANAKKEGYHVRSIERNLNRAEDRLAASIETLAYVKENLK